MEELFYADRVDIVVESGFGLKADAEAELKGAGDIDFRAEVDTHGNHHYNFKGSHTVPFAATVISLRDFIN